MLNLMELILLLPHCRARKNLFLPLSLVVVVSNLLRQSLSAAGDVAAAAGAAASFHVNAFRHHKRNELASLP